MTRISNDPAQQLNPSSSFIAASVDASGGVRDDNDHDDFRLMINYELDLDENFCIES
jgi:hypothetical protein